jgi:hypothetical protein
MPLRPALALILLLPMLSAGCTGVHERAPAPYPALLPLEQILGTPSTATDPGPELAARGAALRRRAAELRELD